MTIGDERRAIILWLQYVSSWSVLRNLQDHFCFVYVFCSSRNKTAFASKFHHFHQPEPPKNKTCEFPENGTLYMYYVHIGFNAVTKWQKRHQLSLKLCSDLAGNSFWPSRDDHWSDCLKPTFWWVSTGKHIFDRLSAHFFFPFIVWTQQPPTDLPNSDVSLASRFQ